METIGSIIRYDIDNKIWTETDRLDEIINIWPNPIRHEQAPSLVKVVIPHLERMNLKEPVYRIMRGEPVSTVPHIGWSRYAHEIQNSRGIRLAETKANVIPSERQDWEQKWLDKGVRFTRETPT